MRGVFLYLYFATSVQKCGLWGINKGGEGFDRPYYAFLFAVAVVLRKFGEKPLLFLAEKIIIAVRIRL